MALYRKAGTLSKITEIPKTPEHSELYGTEFVCLRPDQIIFKCSAHRMFSSYLVIAYNRASGDHVFLNISHSQGVKDPPICQHLFQYLIRDNEYQNVQFDVLFLQLDHTIHISPTDIIPAKNTASFIKEEDLIDQTKTPLRTTRQYINKKEGNKLTERTMVYMRSPATQFSFNLKDKKLTRFSGPNNTPARTQYHPWNIGKNPESNEQTTPSPEKKS